MIRFSAALVIVGLGLLVAGAITSNMTLVYAAIAVSVFAAVVLGAGIIAGRDELFGRGATAAGAERTFDRGSSPGPGTAAIPGEAAGAGLRPLGGRDLATVSAQAGPPASSYTGVGWPDGQSPADELWARVDAELAAAGASSRESKLTRESSPDEVWGAVEEELAVPSQWNNWLVIPATEETVSTEREEAAEPAGQPAWAGRPGWADGADHTDQLVVVEWADTDRADHPGPAEASTATARDADDAQDVAPAENTAADEALANRWALKPARRAAPDQEASVQEAGDQEAATEAAPDRDEVAPDRDQATSDRDGTAPDHAEAVPDAVGAATTRDEATPGRDGAVPDHGEAVPDTAVAAPDRDETASDRDGAVPDHAEAVPDADGAAPDRDEITPDSNGAAPDHAEGVLDGGGTAPDGGGVAPDGGGAGPDSAEAANGAPLPGQDANPASAAPAANAADEPGGDPGEELLAAPSVSDASFSPYVSAGPRSPTTPYPPAASHSPGRSAGHGSEPGRVIVVSGVPRYHRPGCILIRFLGEDDVESVTREAAEASGCVPCRACQPDKLPSAAESGAIG